MCRERGHYVCLCTGRNMGAIYDDVLSLGMDGIIASGGAHIEYSHHTIREMFFPEGNMKKVQSYLGKSGQEAAFTFETNDRIYMNGKAAEILTGLTEEKFQSLSTAQRAYIAAREKIRYCDNAHEIQTRIGQVNKICLWSDETVFREIRAILGDDRISLVQCAPFGTCTYYEIVQTGCNKGDGIMFLCEYLGIPVEHSMAFGDGQNDIDMLKRAGTAVGMKNGSREIFPYVDSVCEEPFRHGIYLELKRRNVI